MIVCDECKKPCEPTYCKAKIRYSNIEEGFESSTLIEACSDECFCLLLVAYMEKRRKLRAG
jgi:hypothetical protein